MKFYIENPAKSIKAYWHEYFCWFPVWIESGRQIVWLETIKRRGFYSEDEYDAFWIWEYKL